MTEITLTFWKLLCITKSMNWNCTGSQIHLKKKLCGFTKKQSSTYFIIACGGGAGGGGSSPVTRAAGCCPSPLPASAASAPAPLHPPLAALRAALVRARRGRPSGRRVDPPSRPPRRAAGPRTHARRGGGGPCALAALRLGTGRRRRWRRPWDPGTGRGSGGRTTAGAARSRERGAQAVP